MTEAIDLKSQSADCFVVYFQFDVLVDGQNYFGSVVKVIEAGQSLAMREIIERLAPHPGTTSALNR